MFNDALRGVGFESLELLLRMSPYLLFGFFVAGIIHVFVSLDTVARHLGKDNAASVIKAVILGIPLPLCSCGVIPAAVLLKKKGASRGAVTSFLISTPITGVDSIFATYSLMGLFFAAFRVISSSITAIVAGLLANVLIRTKVAAPAAPLEPAQAMPAKRCHHCEEGAEASAGGSAVSYKSNRIVELFRYAFVELMGDVWRWLALGIIIGGIISYVIPSEMIERYLGSDMLSMLAMLVVGIPMYVCATGSLPIAASLLMKGMSPGAALVFLLAGPATNAVTITVVARELGKRAAVIYVVTIAVMSVLSGITLNYFWRAGGGTSAMLHHGAMMLPRWVEIASAGILVLVCAYHAVKEMISNRRHS